MGVKKSFEEVYEFYKSKGLILLDKIYKNNNTKMSCIDQEGYKLCIKYSNLKSNKTPSRFHIDNPYTIENINHYIKLNRENVELVEGQTWKGSDKHLNFRCLIHNHIFPQCWSSFHGGRGCPRCSGNEKKSFDEVCSFMNSKKIKVLNSDYINCDSKMNCIDEDGYKIITSYYSIKIGNTPSRFGNGNPNTIENIKHYIDLNMENIELISTEYVDAFEPLLFKCVIHNEEFTKPWSDFKQGQGCPICGKEARYIAKTLNIEILKERFEKSNRYDLEFVSEDYKGTDATYLFKCIKHNNIFKMEWNSFVRGGCCPICNKENASGENHHNWKGGISNLSQHLRTYIRPWKNDSFNKYDKKCDITGIGSSKNMIHHLYPFNKIVKEVMETLNLPIYQEINKYTELELDLIECVCLGLHYDYGLGVCLTEEVHKELHSYYGGTRVEINEEDYYKFKEYYLDKIIK